MKSNPNFHMVNYRILSLEMSETENTEAINDVYSTANWAIFFMYKLFSICHCCHTTVDEVSSFPNQIELILILSVFL